MNSRLAIVKPKAVVVPSLKFENHEAPYSPKRADNKTSIDVGVLPEYRKPVLAREEFEKEESDLIAKKIQVLERQRALLPPPTQQRVVQEHVSNSVLAPPMRPVGKGQIDLDEKKEEEEEDTNPVYDMGTRLKFEERAKNWELGAKIFLGLIVISGIVVFVTYGKLVFF